MKSNGHGGKRDGAGRPTKVDEERVSQLAMDALIKVFGSEQKAFEHLVELGKDSFPQLNLAFAYAYGKPRERIEHMGNSPISWQENRHYADSLN